VTAAQVEQIRQMALDGVRVVDIAAAVQRHPATIYHTLRRLGLKAERQPTIGPRDGTLERVRQWMALREEGATWSDIARQYGCQPENVLLLCQRWGKLAEESDEF
jgi:transposase-like protein